MTYSLFFAAALGAFLFAIVTWFIIEPSPGWYLTQGTLIGVLILAGLIDGRRRFNKLSARKRRKDLRIGGK